MAHGHNPIIKREIDCGSNSNSVVSKSSGVGGNPVALPNSSASNARMGSRRIFAPHYKLQVLDSYRNDSDCKGNQRATARKYGIHRRQIQKWLQCEHTLRATVANSDQNNVKHQFHNISHHQMTVSSSSTAAAAANTHANSNNHHHNQQPYKAAAALDTARHSVALATSSCSSTSSSPAAATVRLTATTKCMNGGGSNLAIQPTTATNTVSIHQPYNHTPAIQHQVPLIQHHHPHHQHQHHLLHQQENVLMPSACLPMLPVSPAPTAANPALELRDYQPISATGNCYDGYHRNPTQPIYESLQLYNSAPIDLSVGPKRHHELVEQRRLYALSDAVKAEPVWPEMEETNNNETSLKYEPEHLTVSPLTANPTRAVDLTCRKRANYTADETSPLEKVQKSNDGGGAEEAAAAKPVKLFKPYLLDDDDESTLVEKKSTGDQRDPIIWSNHPAACLASSGYDTQSSHSGNFQSPTDSTYTFPTGSPSSSSTSRFQSSPATSLYDRTTPPTSATLWCPKGSPVSGYDTASTYSDSSEYHQHQTQYHQHQSSSFGHHHAYSLDLKMQAIDSYYHDMTCRGDQLAVAGKFNVHRNEVQRWLDQEANIRQGIALYV